MPLTLPENWLDVASSKASTKWLEQFMRRHLALLEKGQITPQEFANELEEELASRMLNTPAKQKNYRSNIVQGLKILEPHHPAIELVALSTGEYRRLNDQQRGRVAQRETQYLHPYAVKALVKIAENLLDSDEWSDVGAGLAVLIGRRISEILLSKFSLKTPWSLNFGQMVKKADDTDITIEIPTLAPAKKVLAAIKKLQSGLAIADLKQQGASSRQLKQAVNRRYSLAIAQKCDEYFKGLVSNRSDKDNLYTHIFRAVYATIATHWFCPPNVPEHQYKAEIQGHFTITQDGEKLPNYAARSNYDDYAIGDGQGNRDGRLGIQLGQLSGLKIIAAFRDAPVEAMPPNQNLKATEETLPAPDTDINGDRDEDEERAPVDVNVVVEIAEEISEEPNPMSKPPAPIKRPQIYAADLERLTALMASKGREGSPAELFSALLDAYAETPGQAPQQIATIQQVAQTFNWFTAEIDALKQQVSDLEARPPEPPQPGQSDSPTVDDLQAQVGQLQSENKQLKTKLEALKSENAQLTTQLQETQAQLAGIHQLLGTPVNPAKSASQPTSPAQTTQESEPEKKEDTKQRDRIDSKAKVEAIVQDIINWNTAQPSNDTRLRISISIIKALGTLVGATYQPVIMEVLKEQEEAIDEIHRRFMIGVRHNVSVNKDTVLQDIARDYMGVQNWQEATY
ncbi:MAG: protelomerase family protein [Cyanobacteria bacterium P01_H01_bin.152]